MRNTDLILLIHPLTYPGFPEEFCKFNANYNTILNRSERGHARRSTGDFHRENFGEFSHIDMYNANDMYIQY